MILVIIKYCKYSTALCCTLPDKLYNSSTLPMATISSKSSDTHNGIGVPQNLFLDIAQSLASASLHARTVLDTINKDDMSAYSIRYNKKEWGKHVQ